MSAQSFLGLISTGYWLAGMHFFMRNTGGHGLYLPVNAWGWIYGSLVMGLGLWTITQQQKLRFSRWHGWLWLGALMMLLPMAYPGFPFKEHAVARLLGLFAGLLFLLCLDQWRLNRQERDTLLHLLLGAVAIEATLGLVQYYLLTPDNWLGYDTSVNRPYGIFQQPNVMASFMATGLALAAWLDMRVDGRAWLRALRCAVILAASLLLVLLQSRIGQLGGLLALLLLAPALWRSGRLRAVLGWVALGVLLGLASQWLSHNAALRGPEIYQSAGVRSTYWAYSLKLISQAPWTGWGYGGFESTMLHHYMAEAALNPSMAPLGADHLDHPHNEWLYWGVEGGLAPMLGMLVMLCALMWRLTRAGWRKAPALLALTTPILLHTQTEYPLYHAIALWWALLLLIHVQDAEVEELIEPSARRNWAEVTYRPKLPMRLAALAIPLVVVPFMLTALHTAWIIVRFEEEDRRHPERLASLVNHIAWQNKVDLVTHNLRLIHAIQTVDREELQAYVDWGMGYVSHTPRPSIYVNMIAALYMVGREPEARQLTQRAQMLFPEHPKLSRRASAATPSLKLSTPEKP